MPDTTSSKSQLRSALRQRRQGLSPAQQFTAARELCGFVAELAAWPGAQRITLYLAADGEIDTTALSEQGRALGKQIFLPVIEPDNSLSFATWLPDCPLANNRLGIPEPPAHAGRCGVSDLDIVFLPLVGWDRRGGRLGMGGGFYDRTLSGVTRPLLVGLAHSSQECDHIPRDSWDIPLDFVATDTALHRCRSA